LADYAALGITPAEILFVYSWGLGSVLSLWALGYALGAAITVTRKL